MDNGQVIRRALRVAEECEADVTVTADTGVTTEVFNGKIRIVHEDDQISIVDVLIPIERIHAVKFSRFH